MIPPNSKIALFIPCFTEQLFPETGLALAKLLRYFSMKPIHVPHQTCCGQPAFNSGYRDQVVPLAERFLRLFEPYEWIVAPSGSCVSMVKNSYGDLNLSERGRDRWEKIRLRIYEGTQFIYHQLGIRKIEGNYHGKIAYHSSCHARRELGVNEEPIELLKNIHGLELVIPRLVEECCGFGGTFSVKFSELSVSMGLDKLAAVQETGSHFLTAVDDSCLMHLGGVAKKRRMEIQPIHTLRILADALGL